MELFNDGTSERERLDRSLYAIGRLRRAKFDDLAELLLRARTGYKQAIRAREDAGEPVVLAMADRDAADEALDDLAKSATATLRGRSPNAAKERPYTDIVPDGLDAITGASLDDTPRQYAGLVDRAAHHLPEGDAVRVQLAAEVPPAIEQFKSADEAVKDVQGAQARAQSDFQRAEDDLDRAYEKVAGALIDRVGKRAADRFFWRKARRKAAEPQE